MDLEAWNSLFKVLGIVAVFVSGALGALALFTEIRLNKRQSERLLAIGKDVADAKTHQAEAQIRLKQVESEMNHNKNVPQTQNATY